MSEKTSAFTENNSNRKETQRLTFLSNMLFSSFFPSLRSTCSPDQQTCKSGGGEWCISGAELGSINGRAATWTQSNAAQNTHTHKHTQEHTWTCRHSCSTCCKTDADCWIWGRETNRHLITFNGTFSVNFLLFHLRWSPWRYSIYQYKLPHGVSQTCAEWRWGRRGDTLSQE